MKPGTSDCIEFLSYGQQRWKTTLSPLVARPDGPHGPDFIQTCLDAPQQTTSPTIGFIAEGGGARRVKIVAHPVLDSEITPVSFIFQVFDASFEHWNYHQISQQPDILFTAWDRSIWRATLQDAMPGSVPQFQLTLVRAAPSLNMVKPDAPALTRAGVK
jgi:hypothetical protein